MIPLNADPMISVSTHALMLVTISSTAACYVAQRRQHLFLSTNLPTHTLWGGVDSPFILVPIGSPFFPINAQALSSNLTTIPSFLWNCLCVRTIMACLISPLLTLFAAAAAPPGPLSPIDRDFWTTTIMRSPCNSQLLLDSWSNVDISYQFCRVSSFVDLLRIRLRWLRSCRCNSASSIGQH